MTRGPIARSPRPVVLCDLDDTLFDHAAATRGALTRLHAGEPAWRGWTLDELDRRHRDILDELHLEVLDGRRSVNGAREERFRRLLAAAQHEGAVDEAAARLAAAYRVAYEEEWCAVEGAAELLVALRQQGLRVAIVTNSMQHEQVRKLAHCRFDALIDALVTSEAAGSAKPARAIFDVALRRLDARPEDAVMFGDAWRTDIVGARAAGLRAVWFNRWHLPSPDPAVAEVRSLVPVEAVLKALTGE